MIVQFLFLNSFLSLRFYSCLFFFFSFLFCVFVDICSVCLGIFMWLALV
jgi:hypothetical protein